MKSVVLCDKCVRLQNYTGQHRCVYCDKLLSAWSIAVQLQKDKTFEEEKKKQTPPSKQGTFWE